MIFEGFNRIGQFLLLLSSGQRVSLVEDDPSIHVPQAVAKIREVIDRFSPPIFFRASHWYFVYFFRQRLIKELFSIELTVPFALWVMDVVLLLKRQRELINQISTFLGGTDFVGSILARSTSLKECPILIWLLL